MVHTLRIVLKARLTISKKYVDKDLYLCFRHDSDWYLVFQDTLVEIAEEPTNWLNTPSWRKGQYSSRNPSQKKFEALADFRVE